MCMCVSLCEFYVHHVLAGAQESEESIKTGELELAAVWALGTEPQSSTRTVSSFNWRAISVPAPWMVNLKEVKE